MFEKINRKLFNGYVREPIPMVVLPGIVGVVFLALALWFTWDILFDPPNYQSASKEVVFIESEYDGPTYKLTASDGERYNIPVNSIDTTILDTLVNNRRSVNVTYALQEDRQYATIHIISIADQNGDTIVSEEVVSNEHARNGNQDLCIIWIACLCYWAFILGGYYIVCNAHKFPKLAALFIRKPFRNF